MDGVYEIFTSDLFNIKQIAIIIILILILTGRGSTLILIILIIVILLLVYHFKPNLLTNSSASPQSPISEENKEKFTKRMNEFERDRQILIDNYTKQQQQVPSQVPTTI